MDGSIFQGFRKWFINYVNLFNSEDSFISQNIKLKEEHSLRVYENASLISKSEKLDESEQYLAMTIALFHDIGRFEQFRKYRTFKDSESENHALLGVRILKSANILSFLPSQEKEIIYAAISYHNLKDLPENLNKRCLFHSMLVRDADKLDIFKILDDYYKVKNTFPNPALESELPDIPEYSQYLIRDILSNKISSTVEARTCNDLKLARLAWVFDMNFTETLRLVLEKGYIDKTIAELPQNKEIDEVHAHLKNYMYSALSGSVE
ncbi:HD domain-containing protein [Methanolobus sp. ZRKC2]|uniref:HD domain-containing protein n=1 Tax=Methanolobus sp. ZRKC2 TaxID=3125783 RepID=UPI003254F5ED